MDTLDQTTNMANTCFTSRPFPSESPGSRTELFVSDIHGEYEAFSHLMRSGCGAIWEVIEEAQKRGAFGEEFTQDDCRSLATLIYYPADKIAQETDMCIDMNAWLGQKSKQLLAVLRLLACIRTASELQESYPQDSIELFGPLMSAPCAQAGSCAASYIASHALEESISFVIALCETIQRLAVGNVHMVGDVYDRGPAPDLVVDELEKWPKLDVQWGNHDMLWMGASLGQPGCVANVVRICARYGNLSILRDTYGMDLSPLFEFAQTVYADDPCAAFGIKGSPDISEEELALSIKVQKAMAYIQFKVEARLIAENPSFGLEARNLLHHIDYEAGTVELDGVTHELLDKVFPTIDPADPYRMTPQEEAVMKHLQEAFIGCKRLQRHIKLFLDKGSLYKLDGNILLFHACVPLNADGTFKEVTIFGQTLKGKALYDAVEQYVRDAFKATDPVQRKRGLDFLWYLWLGEGSPLFAKSKMATFELYLIADKAARKEVKNPFYSLLENEEVIDSIFEEFGMDPAKSHIVCGHVPVKVKDGEDPAKCHGRVLIIDGGMSKAYQSTSGIAGFGLTLDSRGLWLAYLDPFCGTQTAIETNTDLGLHWRAID
ncbi:MAG: fructose-bisphosphatase class III [Coriobacteriales bacterium]|nr:fructose-bisphosphatase class III [Coriobacteriales bacterium]